MQTCFNQGAVRAPAVPNLRQMAMLWNAADHGMTLRYLQDPRLYYAAVAGRSRRRSDRIERVTSDSGTEQRFAVMQRLVRCWGNSRRQAALGPDGWVANDPTATAGSVSHCSDEAGFRPIKAAVRGARSF